MRIAKYYGEDTVELVRENPYRMVMDVEGVGFLTADRMALSMGIDPKSEFRIRAALFYLMGEAALNGGHTYLPREMLLDRACKMLHAEAEPVDRQISQALRPLGFRKQGNACTADLAPGTVLQWHAQKSGFSDEYYFNLFIRKQGAVYQGSCFYDRLHPAGLCPLDWQAMPPEVFQHFLDSTVVPVLEKILHTPLEELGKDPSLWRGCSCQRDLCPACWWKRTFGRPWRRRGHKKTAPLPLEKPLPQDIVSHGA